MSLCKCDDGIMYGCERMFGVCCVRERDVRVSMESFRVECAMCAWCTCGAVGLLCGLRDVCMCVFGYVWVCTRVCTRGVRMVTVCTCAGVYVYVDV